MQLAPATLPIAVTPPRNPNGGVIAVTPPRNPNGGPIAVTPPRNPNGGPIGVSTLGELRITHATKGVTYFTEHKLLAPLGKPFAEYTGSLQDAIVAATAAIKDVEMRADGRIAVALLGMPGRWTARTVLADQDVMRAVDHGAGTGDIARIQFTSVSRSLGALVTSGGSLLPGEHRSA